MAKQELVRLPFITLETQLNKELKQIESSQFSYTLAADAFYIASDKLNLTEDSEVLSEWGMGVVDFIDRISNFQIPISELIDFLNEENIFKNQVIANMGSLLDYISTIGIVEQYNSSKEQITNLNKKEKSQIYLPENLADSQANNRLRYFASKHGAFFKNRTSQNPLLVRSIKETNFNESGESETYKLAKELFTKEIANKYFRD